MPKYTFENGLVKRNWDCKQAVNLAQMNIEIDQYLKDGLIFSGFACRNKWFDYPIDIQIHLNTKIIRNRVR